MNQLGFPLPLSGIHPDFVGKKQSPRLKALVIGSGPSGLFAARQLDGLRCYHNEGVCKKNSGYPLSGRKVLIHDLSAVDLSGKHHRSSAKIASGQKLSSLYSPARCVYEPCLQCIYEGGSRLDWKLCSDQPPGGSWNRYLPSQSTLSHFTEMGMPDHPIDGLGMNCTAQPPPPEPCKKIVTDGQSLVNYYQSYARILPSERMMIGKVVSASLKGSVWQDGLFWDVKIQGQEKKEWCVESENLLLAIGRTQPNWLNIPGEKQNPYVSHWTHDACRSIACLQAGGSILVVGDGFSACDTIWEAWQKGLTVTHLLPSWVRGEAVRVGKTGGRGRHGLIQHLNYRQSERHYKVARAMAFPEECAALYRQSVDCRLVRIINGRECWIEKHKDGKVVQHDKIMFDHIALLTGAKADYSFLPDAIKSSLFCSNGVLDVCPETMESRSCRNLFLLGFCAGEVFLRNTFGHAISAVETIRGRERVRQMGACQRNRIESMECG